MSEICPFYRLGPQRVRDNAAKQCQALPEGWGVRFTPPQKSRAQEEKYHAMFGDIARSCMFMGERQDVETWKRLLLQAFEAVKAAEGDPLSGGGRVVPSLDGKGVVQLGVQSRKLTKRHASELVEWLFAWGADNGVAWSDESGVMS